MLTAYLRCCISNSRRYPHGGADLKHTQGLIQLQAVLAFCAALYVLAVGAQNGFIPG